MLDPGIIRCGSPTSLLKIMHGKKMEQGRDARKGTGSEMVLDPVDPHSILPGWSYHHGLVCTWQKKERIKKIQDPRS